MALQGHGRYIIKMFVERGGSTLNMLTIVPRMHNNKVGAGGLARNDCGGNVAKPRRGPLIGNAYGGTVDVIKE